MKNKLPLSLFIIATSLLICSCNDFIAVNLSKKSIELLAPANNTVSTSFTQQFKWEEVKGADQYQLQIVKPNFSSIQQFVLDTNTVYTQFSLTLQPGTYQWRVRAKNNSSNTEYVTYNLTIDTSLNLSGQTIVLTSPADSYNTNSFATTFIWQTMPYADTYVLQILSSGSVISTQSQNTTSGSYTFTADGTYQWRVFAQNSFSSSAFTSRTIIIDNTPPSIPIPVSPIQDTTSQNPIPLVWSGSSTSDSSQVLISTDSTFTTLSFKDTTIANTSNPVTFNCYSTSTNLYYYWKVRAIDRAGNRSAYFTRRRFKRI